MKRAHQPAVQFAVCLHNDDYPASLEQHKIYRVLPDVAAAKEGDIRVIDESGEDYLYPAAWFAIVRVPRAVQQSILGAA